ncbi:hypothetical protein HanXRQr2_Chr05g0195651 [Helianthus annuus]|uniref:Uncharacterized protein n=1 Tax=Helianthus annuus TaxID=4232 RepID=A0A9K3IWU8_HELAN|nr:hypothetical protein HanXRQr2_Chr05g0195651 [Helianthus annuus]KAJ0745983.1 putative ADP-ribosylation factor GTPase-activating protein AGD5/15 [Helianthus annuus]
MLDYFDLFNIFFRIFNVANYRLFVCFRLRVGKGLSKNCKAQKLASFTFVRRYGEKRWAARDQRPISPSRFQENKASTQWQEHESSTSDNKKRFHSFKTQSTKSNIFTTKISLPVPPKALEPVVRKAESAVVSIDNVNEAAEVVSPKVEVATDLFDMLSMDVDPVKNGSKATPVDHLWAGFECTSRVTLRCNLMCINKSQVMISFFLTYGN